LSSRTSFLFEIDLNLLSAGVEYTPYENTFLHLRKRNQKWWNWKVIRGGEAGRLGARWHKSHFHFGLNFLALKGLIRNDYDKISRSHFSRCV